jgi:hypothetical protein
MAQPVQEFGPFDDRAWELARELVKDHFGVEIAADKTQDTVFKDGFQLTYLYDREAKSFRVQLLTWPYFTTALAINEKIHMLCENAVIQSEEEALAATKAAKRHQTS